VPAPPATEAADTEPAAPALTLIASGSETAPALEAAGILADRGISCDVVSMPCLDLFRRQPDEYRQATVRGKDVLVIEAAATTGWEELRPGGIHFKALTSFGASAKKDDILKHFGYTAEQIAETALSLAAATAAGTGTGRITAHTDEHQQT